MRKRSITPLCEIADAYAQVFRNSPPGLRDLPIKLLIYGNKNKKLKVAIKHTQFVHSKCRLILKLSMSLERSFSSDE